MKKSLLLAIIFLLAFFVSNTMFAQDADNCVEAVNLTSDIDAFVTGNTPGDPDNPVAVTLGPYNNVGANAAGGTPFADSFFSEPEYAGCWFDPDFGEAPYINNTTWFAFTLPNGTASMSIIASGQNPNCGGGDNIYNADDLDDTQIIVFRFLNIAPTDADFGVQATLDATCGNLSSSDVYQVQSCDGNFVTICNEDYGTDALYAGQYDDFNNFYPAGVDASFIDPGGGGTQGGLFVYVVVVDGFNAPPAADGDFCLDIYLNEAEENGDGVCSGAETYCNQCPDCDCDLVAGVYVFYDQDGNIGGATNDPNENIVLCNKEALGSPVPNDNVYIAMAPSVAGEDCAGNVLIDSANGIRADIDITSTGGTVVDGTGIPIDGSNPGSAFIIHFLELTPAEVAAGGIITVTYCVADGNGNDCCSDYTVDLDAIGNLGSPFCPDCGIAGGVDPALDGTLVCSNNVITLGLDGTETFQDLACTENDPDGYQYGWQVYSADGAEQFSTGITGDGLAGAYTSISAAAFFTIDFDGTSLGDTGDPLPDGDYIVCGYAICVDRETDPDAPTIVDLCQTSSCVTVTLSSDPVDCPDPCVAGTIDTENSSDGESLCAYESLCFAVTGENLEAGCGGYVYGWSVWDDNDATPNDGLYDNLLGSAIYGSDPAVYNSCTSFNNFVFDGNQELLTLTPGEYEVCGYATSDCGTPDDDSDDFLCFNDCFRFTVVDDAASCPCDAGAIASGDQTVCSNDMLMHMTDGSEDLTGTCDGSPFTYGFAFYTDSDDDGVYEMFAGSTNLGSDAAVYSSSTMASDVLTDNDGNALPAGMYEVCGYATSECALAGDPSDDQVCFSSNCFIVTLIDGITIDAMANGCGIDATFTSNDATINWEVTDGNGMMVDSGTGATANVSLSADGTYTITGTNGGNCSASATIEIAGCIKVCAALDGQSVDGPLCDGAAPTINDGNITLNDSPASASLVWYYSETQGFNPADGTAYAGETLSNTDCAPKSYYFVAVLEGADIDGDNPCTVQSEEFEVQVYTSFTAFADGDGCSISALTLCNDFDVAWETDGGATGTGVFTPAPGASGTVTFTVTQVGAPAGCDVQVTDAQAYNCVCEDPGTCDDGDCSNGVETWNDATCSCDAGTPPDSSTCVDDGDCSNGVETWNEDICACEQLNIPDPNACVDDGDCSNGVETYNTETCACEQLNIPDPDSCVDDGDCSNGTETYNTETCSCDVVQETLGCTDMAAINFDMDATCDDGSCEYECPDPGNCDDGDCSNGVETWNGETCQCDAGTPPDSSTCVDDGDCSNGVETWNETTCTCEQLNIPDPSTCIDDGDCSNGTETWNTSTCTCEQLNVPDPNTCVDDGDCSNGDETWNEATCTCDQLNVPDPSSCQDDGLCGNGTETWNETTCTCEQLNVPDPNACVDDGDCSNGTETYNAATCECEQINVPDPNTCVDDGDCSNGEETYNTETCTCEQLNVPDPSACVDDGDCSNGTETYNTETCSCDVVQETLGCTNETATNFNPDATCDDDSCEFECPDPGNCDDGDCSNGTETWNGETCACQAGTPPDSSTCVDDGDCSNGTETWNEATCTCEQLNIPNPSACVDDGDCSNGEEVYNTANCTCESINAPDPDACVDDGDCTNGTETYNEATCSCEVIIETLGCTNPEASNYNPDATCDDGSCITECPDPGNCDDGICGNGTEVWNSSTCACESINVPDPSSCMDDGVCGNGTETWNEETCTCEQLNIPDPSACMDDGDCSNGTETYNTETCECEQVDVPTPCEDDGDCTNGFESYDAATCECVVTAQVDGCTDMAATNFDSNANCDDGSCVYEGNNPPDVEDFDETIDAGTSGSVNVLDTATDPDGDDVSLSSVGGVDVATGTFSTDEGTFTFDASGNITFDPVAGFTGTVEVTVIVTDGELDAEGTVSFTILPDNTGCAITLDCLFANELADAEQNLFYIFIEVAGGTAANGYAVTLPDGSSATAMDGEVTQLGPFEFEDYASSEFAIAVTDDAGCTENCQVLISDKLAVELVEFTGEVLNNGNELSWITASETNNDYFTLLRSMDGVNFTEIAVIDGNNTTNGANSYNFLDKDALLTGTYYYALQQTDIDGTTTVSSTISLVRSESNGTRILVSPIPATDVVNVTYAANVDGEVSINIYSIAGKLMSSRDVTAVPGSNTYSLDVTDLAAGVYFVAVKDGDSVYTSRIIKD